MMLLGSGISHAQGISIERPQSASLLATVGDDLAHVATSPFRMSGNDALLLTSFVALNTLMIYGFDHTADEEFGIEVDDDYLRPAQELVKLGEVYALGVRP